MREDQQHPPLLPSAEGICFRSKKRAAKHQLHVHALRPTTISGGFHLPTVLVKPEAALSVEKQPLEPSTGAEASPREGQFPRNSFPQLGVTYPVMELLPTLLLVPPHQHHRGKKKPPRKQILLHATCFETEREEEEEKAKQRGSGSIISLKISAGTRCN